MEQAQRRERAESNADRHIINWIKHSVDWFGEYPELLAKFELPRRRTETKEKLSAAAAAAAAEAAAAAAAAEKQIKLDLIDDLLPLDMGVLMRKLCKEPTSFENFGYIPLMAGCSPYQIGSLNAESFCERVISACNLVMTTGNTLLGNEELEMLVLLRINRQFMEHMRIHHPEVSNQGKFNRTRINGADSDGE